MFSKIVGKCFDWLGDRSLCPCGLASRTLSLFGLENSKSKAVGWFVKASFRLCGWALIKTPISQREKLELDKLRAESKVVKQAEEQRQPSKSDRLWN